MWSVCVRGNVRGKPGMKCHIYYNTSCTMHLLHPVIELNCHSGTLFWETGNPHETVTQLCWRGHIGLLDLLAAWE